MAIPNRYQNIDWPFVWKSLWVYAYSLVGTSVVDCAISSAEDLAQETVEEFFASHDGLGWKSRKGTLEQFLCGVLKHKFIDHVRRDRKVVPKEELEELPGPDVSEKVLEQVQYERLCGRLRKLIRGRPDEKELEEFILATSMITGSGKRNQELADLLGIDTQEVVNRRNKLLRIAGVKELYEEWKERQGSARGKH